MAAPLSSKTVLRLSVLPCLFLLSAKSRAETVSALSTGLALTVNLDGRYSIQSQDPPFGFGGDIGTALTDLVSSSGADNLGPYRQIAFHYTSAGQRAAGIRIYSEKPIVLFSVSYLEAAPNADRFPALTGYPSQLFHLTYDGIFGMRRFNKFAADSPWIFFDGAANTFILSPASHFNAATTVMGSTGAIESGIDSSIAALPQDFRYDTILVVEKGVNKAFDTWGRALTSLFGKNRAASDAGAVLNQLGYWTDNGASYYYKPDPDLGYTDTLKRVKEEFDRKGAPLGYLQLDSWFYPKGADARWNGPGGIYRYEAAADLFASGLDSFQRDLGIPLVTHARWIDAASPYRRQYKMSNNVATDPLYWETLAEYLRASGVVAYEQDWLGVEAYTKLNLDDGDSYLGNMSRSLRERKLTIQYCMAMPHHYLDSVRHDNVTTIRTSGDRLDRSRWDEFLFATRFASALGVWPWSDVFMSRETDNLLLSTLSAGPVGVGDRIGEVDAKNLLRSVRGDGVIVKPDEPIVPLDETFIRDAQGLGKPMVAFTHTDFERSRALYVFAYRRGEDSSLSFTPAALGMDGPVYVYNYFKDSGVVADSASAYQDSLDEDRAYYIVVPIGPSGIGFLGDAGHFVPLGRKRVAGLRDGGVLEATISFARGETSRMLFGYSPSKPVVTAARGSAAVPVYDDNTHLFRVSVAPDENGVAAIAITR
jgi:hypothetical protein